MKNIISVIFVIALAVTGCNAEKPAAVNMALEQKDLIEFIDILETYRDGVLANRNGENLRTQIITFSFAEDNKAFFCTTSDKPMYTQLVAYPNVSYCTFPEDFEPVLSLNGKVVFTTDVELMEKALESNYYAKRNFKTVDNPLLKVFYIDVEEIETYTFSGAKIYRAK